MKFWQFSIFTIILGIAAGAAASYSQFHQPELLLPDGSGEPSAARAPVASADAKPRVYLPQESTTYDFGVMTRNEERSHTFLVQNIGAGDLTLNVIDTTCKCTVASVDGKIPSGETAKVTLTWQAKSFDPEFRQSAKVETNDQSRRELTFEVVGRVIQLAAPDRYSLKLSRISRSEPQQMQFSVFAFRDDDFALVDHQWLNPETADFFDVDYQSIPREELESDEITSAVRVTIDVKPGLPLGALRQVLKLRTNKLDIPPLEMPIEVSVISDISVVGGREFNDETNALFLGPVWGKEGRTVPLHLLVKGRFRDQVEFEAIEVTPASSLEVELGEPSFKSGGLVKMVPLIVRIPPGSPPGYHMGNKQGDAGSIVLKTNHPEIDQFEIRVAYVVQ